jgi:hypothetical protein
MITVFYFVATLMVGNSATLVQIGPFVSEDQCQNAKVDVSKLHKFVVTTKCFQGMGK